MSEGFKVDEYIVTIDGNEDFPISITDGDTGDEVVMTFDIFDRIVSKMNDIRGK
jgi:hypothetical protein